MPAGHWGQHKGQDRRCCICYCLLKLRCARYIASLHHWDSLFGRMLEGRANQSCLSCPTPAGSATRRRLRRYLSEATPCIAWLATTETLGCMQACAPVALREVEDMFETVIINYLHLVAPQQAPIREIKMKFQPL